MSPSPEELIEYLSTTMYEQVTLLDPQDLSNKQRSAIPQWILDALAHDGPAGVAAAMDHWQCVLPGVLGETGALFRERAVALFFGRVPAEWGGYLVLIYVLRGHTRPYVCWYGYLPIQQVDETSLIGGRPGNEVDLAETTDEVRTFYTRIHNRFRLVGLGECGLPPLNEMFTLDWTGDDWEYEGASDRRPDPNRLLTIFIASGGTLCLELGTEHVWQQYDSVLESMGALWPNINERIRHFTETHGELDVDAECP